MLGEPGTGPHVRETDRQFLQDDDIVGREGKLYRFAPETPRRGVIAPDTGYHAAATEYIGHHAVLAEPLTNAARVCKALSGKLDLAVIEVDTGEIVAGE